METDIAGKWNLEKKMEEEKENIAHSYGRRAMRGRKDKDKKDTTNSKLLS